MSASSSSVQQQLNNDRVEIRLFLNDPAVRVKYFMAIASKVVAKLKTTPTEKKPMSLSGNDREQILGIWTALMVIGTRHPDPKMRFTYKAITVNTWALYSGEIKEELGYFSTFSKNSHYETQFKHYLTDDMLMTGENLLEIDNIIKSIENPEAELETRAIETVPNTQKQTQKTIERVSYKITTLDEETIDTEVIKTLLSNNQNQSEEHKNTETDIDINSKEKESGNTILIQTILRNKHRIAEYLLMLGADPAIKNNNYQIASDLVPKDAPLYMILKGYELIYASFNNNITNVKLILDKGADVNFQGLGGYTPLLIAAEQNFTSLTEFLLLSGADISLTRADGQGIFDLVTDKDLVPFDSSFYMILKGHELIHAVSNGDLKKVKLILVQGVDINFRSLGEYTPLLIAVEQNFPELTELLLESGADATLTRSDGQGIFDLVTDAKVYAVLNNMVSPMYGEPPLEEDDSPQAPQNPYYFFSAIQSTLSNVTHRIQNMFTNK